MKTNRLRAGPKMDLYVKHKELETRQTELDSLLESCAKKNDWVMIRVLIKMGAKVTGRWYLNIFGGQAYRSM